MKKIIVYITTAVSIGLSSVYAQQTWSGGTSADWHNDVNWSSEVPDTTDAVTINTNTGNWPVVSAANADALTLLLGTAANSTASLTIQNGRTLTLSRTGNTDSSVGTANGSDASLTITGAGSQLVMDERLFVGGGNAGVGTVTVSSGGELEILGNRILRLGNFSTNVDAVGNLDVNAGVLTLTGTSIQLGNGSTGNLTISNGGNVTTTGSFRMGTSSLAEATTNTLSVSGTGSILNSGVVDIGSGSSTTNLITLAAGGTWNVTSAPLSIFELAKTAGSAATLQFGNGAGAGSISLSNDNGIVGGAGDAQVIFNHNEGNYTFGTRMRGNIDIAQNGPGTTTLTATNSDFVGDIAVNAGTLSLAQNATMRFNIGASGVNNGISGAGALTLNGVFNLDLSGASTTVGSSWSLVNADTVTWGSTFNLLDIGGAEMFVKTGTDGSAVFTSDLYQFSQTTGLLTVVPEPTSMALLGGLLVLLASRRLRRSLV